jgi:hypothetical protein
LIGLVRLWRPSIMKRLKWCKLLRNGSRDGRRFCACEKKQNERLKRPEKQRKLRGKLRRLRRRRRLGREPSRQLQQWRRRSRLWWQR